MWGQRGWKVLAIEQHARQPDFPRAIALDSEIIRAVQSVGLLEEALPLLRPHSGLHLTSARGRPLLHARVGTEDGFAPQALFYQPAWEEMLLGGAQRFPSVTLCFGWRAQQLEQHADFVSVQYTHLQTGETRAVRARYVLACDGAHSTVRGLLGIREKSFSYEGTSLKVDARVHGDTAFPTDGVEKQCSTTLPYVRMAGKDNHRRWEFPIPRNADKAEYERPAKVRALVQATGYPLDDTEIVHAVCYRYRAVVQREWRQGRVLLAGDAAHVTPPFIGQGMCGGFRDVVNLDWKLDAVLRGTAPESLLDTYQSEREPHFRFLLRVAVWVGRAFTTPLYRLLLVASYIPVLRTALLHIAVASPPQGKGCFGTGKGARTLFPQAVLAVEDQAIWSDEYWGTDWVLLSLTPPDAATEMRAQEKNVRIVVLSESLDPSGVLRRWLGTRRIEVALLRPDKYVFATGRSAGKLLRFLASRRSWRGNSGRR